MTRVRGWLAVWIGWTALALFFAAGNSLTYKSMGRPANWTFTIERSLAEYWAWALVTPAIVLFTARFPLQRPRLAFHAALHGVFGAGLAVAKMAADREVLALMTGVRTYLLASTVAFNFAAYVGIVAAAHGVEFYRRSRERDQLEARLADARLQLLGMQLQPHFLFNTLNTIAELVHEDPDTADRMIAHLSDLLRRTLDLGRSPQVALASEVDLVSRYIDIQRARFGERLQVTIDVERLATHALVPPLLLQPLVENAIRHGLGARLDAGRITVAARVADRTLVLTVTDDGEGAATGGAERVGLGNTRARLDALYGARARLELSSSHGGGTRATIVLPFTTEGALS